MAQICRRTISLPDHIAVTILRVPDHLTVQILKEMLSAELYILAGATADPDGRATGFGAYVGTSCALDQRVARAGVSLRKWVFALGRLHPEAVILVNRGGKPMNENARLLIEASLARAISTGYTILNTRMGAPAAELAATRHQRLWAMHTSARLTDLVLKQVFHPHPAAAQGGTTREQLIRLVLAQHPPRALNVHDVLRLAETARIPILGRSPAQRTRRDLSTREHAGATGCPRVLRTHIGGLAVIYPAHMTVRHARADYLAAHAGGPDRGTRRAQPQSPA